MTFADLSDGATIFLDASCDADFDRISELTRFAPT